MSDGAGRGLARRRLPLAGFWFLYMAGLGTFFPFAGLYLAEDLGFPPDRVGLVLAVVPLAGLVFQPLWSQLADRTAARARVMVGLALGAAATALALGELTSFAAVAVGTFAFAAFHTSVLPMATAVSLAEVGSASFGLVRIWGTLGFLALATSFPRLARWLDAGSATPLAMLFPVVAALSLGAVACGLLLPPNPNEAPRSRRGELGELLARPAFKRLLLVAFAAHASIQAPIYLFPLFVASRGGDSTTVSRMWFFMLLLEIPLIAFSGPTLRRLGPRGLLACGLGSETVRWCASALIDDLAVLTVVQLLHGVGVAGLLVGLALYCEAVVPPELRSTGQALVAMVGAGAGAVASNLVGGWTMRHVATEAPYWTAAVATALLLVSLRRLLPDPRRREW